MYYGMLQFLYNLFMENKDAIVALPTPIKTIALVTIIITIGTSFVKKAMRILTIATMVAIAYFGAVYLRLI